MARVIWSPEAADDLDAIRDYIRIDSEQYACLVAERIIGAVEGIGDFPEAGSIVPEFQNPNVRERFVHRYRIIYELRQGSDDVAEIITIVHGSRRLTDI